MAKKQPVIDKLVLPAKKLGLPLMPDYCERCHYIVLHMHGQFPFAPFPSIFSVIDSNTKKIFDWCFREGDLHSALACLGNLTENLVVPTYQTFQVDVGDDMVLRGSPDAIFKRDDGSLVIADYKCAQARGEYDPLFPVYRAQLSAYKYLAEALEWGTVAKMALIYTEPFVMQTAEQVAACKTKDGIKLDLRVKVVEVEPLTDDEMNGLFDVARKIYGLPVCPLQGRPGCRSCVQVDNLLDMVLPQIRAGASESLRDSIRYDVAMAASRIGAYARLFPSG
jgi:hypothetical protein